MTDVLKTKNIQSAIPYYEVHPLGAVAGEDAKGEAYLPTDYYYYTINNLPLLRLDDRDKLIGNQLQTSHVCGFPARGNIDIFDQTKTGFTVKDIYPVIIDFNAGVLHRTFSKQNLNENEAVLFVVPNAYNSSISYTDNDTGWIYYYVLSSVMDRLIPSSYITTTLTGTDLYEAKINLDINGGMCTTEVSANKVKDSNGKAVVIGVIKSQATGSKYLCSFGSSNSINFGNSVPSTTSNHATLDDILASQTTDPSTWVYGHFGYTIRINKITQTGIESDYAPAECDLVAFDTTSLKLIKYATPSGYTGGTPSLPIGFLYKKTSTGSGSSKITNYYIVEKGEWSVAGTSYTIGEEYYAELPNGNLVTGASITESTDDTTPNAKIGSVIYVDSTTGTTTFLLDLSSIGLAEAVNTNSSYAGGSTFNTGNQVAPEVFGENAMIHRRYTTEQDGLLPSPTLGIGQSGTSKFVTGTSYNYKDDNIKNYGTSREDWAKGDGVSANQKWGSSPSGYPVALDFSEASTIVTDGTHLSKGTMVIKRLSPEYFDEESGDTAGCFDRLFVYVNSNLSPYELAKFRAEASKAGINTFDSSIPLTSAMDYSVAHNIHSTSGVYDVKSKVDTGSSEVTGIAQEGSLLYLKVTLEIDTANNKYDFSMEPIPLANGVYDTGQVNKGISLKRFNGVLGLYVEGSAPNPTSGNKQSCIVFYEDYVRTVANDGSNITTVTYQFNNVTVKATDSTQFASDKASYSKIISLPVGALSFTVGLTDASDGIAIAGMYNPSPTQLYTLSKYKTGSIPFDYEITKNPAGDTVSYMPAPFGNPFGLAISSLIVDQSLLQSNGYINLDQIDTLSTPLDVNGGSGPTTNFYPYVESYMMFRNPYALNYFSNLEGYVDQLFLIADSFYYIPGKRLGIISEPFSGTGQAQYKDGFFFGNKNNILLAPVLRSGNYPLWKASSGDPESLDPSDTTSLANTFHPMISGAACIIYIYRQDKTKEGYVDFDFDETSLAHQLLGNYMNENTPAGEPSARNNYDMNVFVNGKLTACGPGDSLRIWLPPSTKTDIRANNKADAGTRQLPLTLKIS